MQIILFQGYDTAKVTGKNNIFEVYVVEVLGQ